MDYLSHNVAVNLKRIRRSRGMSLDLVAEQTGVSKSMLAQIEKDRANPSREDFQRTAGKSRRAAWAPAP